MVNDLLLRSLQPNAKAWIQSFVRSSIKRRLWFVCFLPFRSSTEAERSFSSLRRLKTYLMKTMTQARLKHLAILDVHQELTDFIDFVAFAKEFVSKCDVRLITFGQWLTKLIYTYCMFKLLLAGFMKLLMVDCCWYSKRTRNPSIGLGRRKFPEL